MRLFLVLILAFFSIQALAQTNIILEPLRNGDIVYTSYGQQGTINGVFGDGTVSVNINGYNSTLQRTDIAGQGCSNDACTPSSTVTRYGQEGTISGVFPSGELSVKINGYNSKLGRNDVSIEACLGPICSGDTVTTSYGQTGTVNGIYPDGKVSVKINGYNSVLDAKDLASKVGGRGHSGGGGNRYNTHRAVRSGETIFTTYGQEGVVNGVFGDGRASVMINGYSSTMDRNDLAVTGCIPSMCSGDTVTTKYGQTGTINGFFMNDDVSVKINGYNSKINPGDLAVNR